MNPISLAMDGLLAVLLVTAVAIGLRLNGKLKLLRESQGGFVKAVADLDGAAARAEAGLASLRIATQEAHDQLLTRIETARGLIPRLDRASGDAGTAAARLEEAVRGADAAARRAAAAAERAAPRPAVAQALAAAPAQALAQALAPALAQAAARPAAEPIPFPSLRGEPAEAGLRAALLAAKRIVAEADAAPASAPRPAAIPVAAAMAEDRLSRFVARRRAAAA